jgi:capsular exopolysaccharide synthesis family protein
MMEGSSRVGPRRARTERLREAAAEADGDEIDVRRWIRTIWRRKWFVATPALLATTLAAVLALRMEDRYTAVAEVLIDPGREQVANMEDIVAGIGRDRAAINTEIDVLTSRGLAVRVVEELGLERHPEFNPELRPEPALAFDLDLDPVAYLPEGWRAWFEGAGAGGARAAVPEPLTPVALGGLGAELDPRRERMAEAVLSRLAVRPKGDQTRVILIEASAGSPRLAASLANGVSELYLESQLEAKFGATRRATRWLGERVDRLKEQVRASEEAVAAYRKAAGLVRGERSTVTTQQLSELNSELILAQTEQAEAEARYAQVRRQVARGGVDAAAKVLDSDIIDQLRAQRGELQRRSAELATQFGPKHPRMINLRAEVTDIDGQIRAEVEKTLQRLTNELEVARTRAATLRDNVSALEAATADANTRGVKLRQLEREAEANRQLYETFLARLKETSAKEGTQTSDARIISHAGVPAVPSGPNRKSTVTAAFALSLGFGLGLVVLLEKLDRGLRSGEQVEQLYGLPGLGLLPMVGRRPTPAGPVRALARHDSAYAEALRNLHASVLLSDLDAPPGLVLFTSSAPGEGKSATAASLARVLARAGTRALLIDADLRRPQLHRTFELARAPGFVDVVSGETAFDAAVSREEATGVHVLPAGRLVQNPADMLAADRTRRVLEDLGRRYDIVLLDAPPANAVADARILGVVADSTVFLARWGETPREQVLYALRQLDEAGARLAGVALTMVNVRKHAQYGYADSGYYTGRYGDYCARRA